MIHGQNAHVSRAIKRVYKTIKTTKGNVEINVPRDRDAGFEPQIIPKREKDVSGIEDKVLAMYARGMSQRDISSTIEDIYGFKATLSLINSENQVQNFQQIAQRIFDSLKSNSICRKPHNYAEN